jgi:hypothetical protein
MQPLLLFFVDAASLIEADDPDWDLLLAVESNGDECIIVSITVAASPAVSFPAVPHFAGSSCL